MREALVIAEHERRIRSRDPNRDDVIEAIGPPSRIDSGASFAASPS
jgi:hypothetical protein